MRWAFAVLALAGTNCVSLPKLTTTQVIAAAEKWPEANALDLEAGRRLYRVRCGGCHLAMGPSDLKHHAWENHWAEMADKAELESGDRDRVYRFVWALLTPAELHSADP